MPINNNFTAALESVELVHSGTDYFSRLEHIIQNAKYEIHLQFYIFSNDSIGTKILEELKKAASRRVKIYILLDGFGSYSFSKEVIVDLKKLGINFRLFSPFFSANSFYIGRRLHHKVVVADAEVILIGGINISDKYHGTPAKKPWLDYSVQINDIKMAKALQLICWDLFFKKKYLFKKKLESIIPSQEETVIRIIQNDWLKRKNEIYDSYIDSFNNAQQEIIIVGSYFLPGRRMTNALKKAAKNKVKIKLILAGISDVTLSKRATYHIYSSLLENNIELYEWNKTILHGKAAVVDGSWTTIGSFNLNNLSSYASLEMNVEIKSSAFSSSYIRHLNEIIAQCQRITPESLKKRNTIPSDVINWLSYWTARMILNIATYFPYKRLKKLY
ncbi:phospholipase D-like domain-containing protein [Flavobacterium frigoris]|uniref:Phospholipase D/Transphosphatidylase n=1 Tax=Flavobacterium frigoris (strain PS1) TaxID=1086011 RepID=H7FUD0_FLAFP|nr:phospholipase D-like domain-containing protein [Flavobacterium frigoris]EIA07807.1 phospholipase D/Transphosphatidylase [Flavobacterium frigoris PS1]